MKQVPFTVHIKVFPARPGKRFEYVREMQKIATVMYDALQDVAGLNLARPSGGQQRSYGRFSGATSGGAIRPQFGDAPPLVQFSGFWEVDAANAQPHPDRQLIHAGEVRSGPGAHAWDANPAAHIESEVLDLLSVLEANLDTIHDSINFRIFRLDYSGIIWGDRGYTFPR